MKIHTQITTILEDKQQTKIECVARRATRPNSKLIACALRNDAHRFQVYQSLHIGRLLL